MFGPVLDIKEDKLRRQGRSLTIGLWSLIFTACAEDDRQFADLYEDYIDKTAGEDWHCICFAKSVLPVTQGDKGWRADRELHGVSQQIRSRIRSRLIAPSASGILFFNPFTVLQEGSGIFIPLDVSRLPDEEYYQKGINKVTEAVRYSRPANAVEFISGSSIDEHLAALERALHRAQILGAVSAVFDKAIGPLLSRLFTLASS